MSLLYSLLKCSASFQLMTLISGRPSGVLTTCMAVAKLRRSTLKYIMWRSNCIRNDSPLIRHLYLSIKRKEAVLNMLQLTRQLELH